MFPTNTELDLRVGREGLVVYHREEQGKPTRPFFVTTQQQQPMSRNSALIQRTIAFLPSAATSQAPSVALAQRLALAVEALISEREANEAALLCAIGMSRHPRLTVLRDRVLTEGQAVFAEIESVLAASQFVDPESQTATHADAQLAWSTREAVDFVFDPSDRVLEFPSTNRWLEACLRGTPAFQQALHQELTETDVLDRDIPARIVRGEVRQPGGMVDAKPVSTDARRAAEKVKELNKDYKKQQTQRQKEAEAAATAAATATTEEEEGEKPAASLEFTLGQSIASTDGEKIPKCVEMLKTATGLGEIELVHHAAAMDATELDQALLAVPGIKCKNLFLKCKKKRNAEDLSGLYLVCVPTNRQVDLKALQKQLGLGDQLRFASQDALSESLDVLQGSVTPFALVNDSGKTVNVVLDEDMLCNAEEKLWFHPLDNTASVGIPAAALVRFVKASGRNPFVLNLSGGGAAPVKSVAPATASKKSASRGAEGEKIPTKKPAPIDSTQSAVQQVANTAAPVVATPLVLALTHELARDRLWARLEKLGVAPPKRLEVDPTATDQPARPAGHDTHNLLVKDSKTKKLYLVSMPQATQVDLKQLGEKLGGGAVRLAGPADVETAIALTKGCITPMWLFNNVQGNVVPVFDAKLMAEPDRALVICAGCDSALDHTQHNVVHISINQILQLVNEGAAREHITVDL
ncbi:hypothetical protein BASA81_003893 [Batrachochytrium salamandrivorans]|nr:hypothetical protein BASA81_003893 [Batrachochytrium salamandrivorans]